VSLRIEDGLYKAMSQACEQPALIREKGEASLQRIREEHSPTDRARVLTKMYTEAVVPH